MTYDASVAFLRTHKRFAPLIKKFGPPTLRRGASSPFSSLARAIIYQQISGKAAESMYIKFLALFNITLSKPIDWHSKKAQQFPTPNAVYNMSEVKMRTAGLSTQKTTYLRDLARVFMQDKRLSRKLQKMSNDDIIQTLCAIKGVGEWTVHMFLMFNLQRLDILPVKDLGIRKGFQVLYNLKETPAPKQMEKLAGPWRAHATVACWYLWRVADAHKKVRGSVTNLKS